MEQLKAWALSVCMACVATAILQQIAGGKAKFSVIKMVATLYILVVSLTPLQALRYPDTRLTLPQTAAASSVDTDAYVLSKTKTLLQQQLIEACSAAQCPVQEVDVCLAVQNGAVQVEQVTVRCAPEIDRQAVRGTIENWLGTPVPVEVKEG